MAKEKARDAVNLKRMWVQVAPAARKELLHLAIDLDESAEKLAGRLLAQAVQQARAELEAAKRKGSK